MFQVFIRQRKESYNTTFFSNITLKVKVNLIINITVRVTYHTFFIYLLLFNLESIFKTLTSLFGHYSFRSVLKCNKSCFRSKKGQSFV